MSTKPNTVDLATLWRNKRLLFGSTFVCLLLGVAALQLLKPGYVVSSRVWVERLSMPNELTDALSVSKDFIPTQAEIIRSPAVLNPVLEKLNLPLEEGMTHEELLTSTMERLSVDPLIGTNVLSLRFRDADRQRAIDTVRLVIESYRTYVQDTEKDTHRETLELVAQQDERLRQELSSLHEQQQSLRERIADATQIKESAKVRETLLADHARSLSEVKTRRMQLEHHIETFFSPERLAKIFRDAPVTKNEAADGEPETRLVALRPISDPEIQLTNPETQAAELKQAIDVLTRMSREDWLGLEDPTPLRMALLETRAEHTRIIHRYGPKHPKLMAVQDRVDDLTARLRNTVKSAAGALDRELESIRRHEASLATLYETELGSIQGEIEKSKVAGGYTLREKHVLNELQRVQTAHDAVLARMHKWTLTDEAVATGRLGVVVRMLEEPSAVLTGIDAPVPLTLGISGLLGLMGGAVVVSQLEQRRNGKAHSNRD